MSTTDAINSIIEQMQSLRRKLVDAEITMDSELDDAQIAAEYWRKNYHALLKEIWLAHNKDDVCHCDHCFYYRRQP